MPAEHARTWALIPWLVNGRADARQRAAADHHLAGCADCRAELLAQQRLHQLVQRETPPAAAEVDAQAGLQRLLGRIDQLPEDQAVAPAPRRRAVLPVALAAAVIVQAIGLALLSLQLARQDDAPYATLSRAPAAAAGAATLRVVPDPALPLQQWQALLQDAGLRIVDGPNAAGAYALAPQDPAAPAATAEQLARLRAAPGIRLAEALDPPR
ncbi:zf-HC2 domain-containing protein [Aquincola sp. S2]|uniref:Zf-HC2 domain-containing protein n=1 Tax=Pseudaquabacterium terrae TaxID=2732868 RepID=A0ABX2ECY1_9BURK|nr:zf-HC2 domain-containing protein [Aquabacterium terrae]NRF65833.1 zf-HC2 domain-containing protein [Aquabacterium terrae]